MKKILFILSILTITSQAQDGINYQGVATNGSGVELINQNISIKASIISDSITGTVQWQETHNTTTDQFGLFNVVIGQGSSTGVGQKTNFDNINWGSSNHYLKIEIDATGGSNFILISTSQMMSVPYALYAKSAGIDSTMLANMISTSVPGVGGGVCNFNFPEGLYGESIIEPINTTTSYTVPTGKRLYLTVMNNQDPVINGKDLTTDMVMGTAPVILNSGDVLTGSNSDIRYFNGILINESSEITAITEPINTTTSYIVPSGKKLYLLLLNNSNPIINGKDLYTEIIAGTYPVILNPGDTLTGSDSQIRYFNGYLADENYFADCGGGSLNNNLISDPSSPNFITPTVVSSKNFTVSSPITCNRYTLNTYNYNVDYSSFVPSTAKSVIINIEVLKNTNSALGNSSNQDLQFLLNDTLGHITLFRISGNADKGNWNINFYENYQYTLPVNNNLIQNFEWRLTHNSSSTIANHNIKITLLGYY